MNMGKDNCCVNFKEPKFVIKTLVILILGAIVITSIIRERLVRYDQNQVTIYGQGKVAYSPDEARVTLGVQVDKVFTAQDALRQLNDKMTRVTNAIKDLGIKEENIKTESYSLYPSYDYANGTSTISGYNARQNLVIKVEGVDKDSEIVSRVVSAANNAEVNNISGIDFNVSNLSDLKQKARIQAIADAKTKASDIFKAAGVKPRKIVSWFENTVSTPDSQNSYGYGIGGAEGTSRPAPSPQVPSGTQEIVIEMGVNYEVK